MNNRYWVITFENGTVYRAPEHMTNVKAAIEQAVLNCNDQTEWDVVKAEAKPEWSEE